MDFEQFPLTFSSTMRSIFIMTLGQGELGRWDTLDASWHRPYIVVLPGIFFHARPGYSESVLARQVDEQVTVKNDDGSRGKKHLLIIHFGLWYGLILIVLRVASTRSRKSKEPWKEVMKSHERQSSTNSFDQQTRKDTKCQLPSNSVTMPMSLLPPLLIKQVTNDNCSI